jgi:hypothetical protein
MYGLAVGAFTSLIVQIRAFCRRRNGARIVCLAVPESPRRMLTGASVAHNGGIRSNLQLTALSSVGERARWTRGRQSAAKRTQDWLLGHALQLMVGLARIRRAVRRADYAVGHGLACRAKRSS